MTITVVNPAELVDYTTVTTPSSYKCGDCGAANVKLWRDYQTFLEHQTLRCADCAAKKSKKDISSMQANGRYTVTEQLANGQEFSHTTDTIDWLIPAVPTEQNDTFWGYSSVPQDGCEWWERLPVR